MKKTKAQLEAELLRVQGKLQDLGRTASAVMGERDELAMRLSEMEKSRDGWREASLDIIAKRYKAEARAAELEAQRDAAERERDELAAKLVEKGAAVSFLEGQLAAVESNLKSASDQFASAEDRAAELEAERTEAEQQLAVAIQAELETRKHLQREIAELKSRLISADAISAHWEARARALMRPW